MARLIRFTKLVKALATRKSLEFKKQIAFLMEKALVEKSKDFKPKKFKAEKFSKKTFGKMKVAGRRTKTHKSVGTFRAPILKSK